MLPTSLAFLNQAPLSSRESQDYSVS